MERDFLGVMGKESDSLNKEDSKGNRMDSGTYGPGSAWPFSSAPSYRPQFMSIKTLREEKQDPQFSISGFQPKTENSIIAPAPAPAPQVRGAHPNGSRVFPVVSHQVAPFSQNSPFMKAGPYPQNSNNGGFNLNNHLVGTTVGFLPPRDYPKPPNASQLTIFYAGSVCSFDNVPMDKAKEILMLASKASALTLSPRPLATAAPPVVSSEGPKLETPVRPVEQVQNRTLPIVSSSVSLVTQNNDNENRSLSRSRSSSNNTESNLTPKMTSLSPLGPTSQPDLSGLGAAIVSATMPRAVPQARKASLARFLEKRKERVTSVAPYECRNKSPLGNCDKLKTNFDTINNSKLKQCQGGFELSKDCEDLFPFGQSNMNSSCFAGEAMDTNLQI